jgi:alkane 1-monooxygenase
MNWKALKFALPLLMYFGALRSFTSTGWPVWITLAIAWVLIPLLEIFLQPNATNASEAEEELRKKDALYDLLIYLIVPLQYTTVYLFLININQPLLSWYDTLGRVLTMGLFCGTFGINAGHELGHRHKKYEQLMAKALLLTSLYTHFFIEHNKGHHKNVATANDPSSAPYRITLYAFWLRSITGVYKGAWHIANEEQRKKILPWWRNEMWQLQLLQLFFIVIIYIVFSATVLLYFLAAAIIGILLLETVNYVEHYGLTRQLKQSGLYERAMPQHSWNSNHVIGRLILFELSRHSDHHFMASRKYQLLRHHDDAPQLPTGYPGSMILSTIPPLWFFVMDKQMKRYGLKPV